MLTIVPRSRVFRVAHTGAARPPFSASTVPVSCMHSAEVLTCFSISMPRPCLEKCETRKKIRAARKDGKPYKKNGKKCGRGYNAKGSICYSQNIKR